MITGANRGLGFATARRLAQSGVKVIVGARNVASGEQAAGRLRREGLDCEPLHIDVASSASVRVAAALVQQQHGRVDILINNAAILPEATASDVDRPRPTQDQRCAPRAMVAPDRRCDPTGVRRRLQGSAGQSTVEWLVVMVGVIALAGVLVTTLPGVAGAITASARSMICKVGGMSCPSSSSPGQGSGSGSGQGPNPSFKPLDPSAPTNGPRIGGHPRDVGAGLPFPGSVSVTAEQNDEGKIGSKGGYKVGVSATYERTTSPCSIDGTGTPSVTLSASADIKVTAGVNGEGKGMGAAVSGSLGDKTSYDVKTNPANADKIDRGELPPPNPADPYSIPKGSSITLNGDSYKGSEGSVTYHNITAELGYKDGRRVSSAVERVGDDKVRITVGDLQDVDKNYVDGYQQLSGHDGESGSNRDLTLNYSPDDLDTMQDAALDQILAAQRGWDGSPFKDGGTRDQLRAYLAEHPEADGLAPYGGVTGRIILTDMAAAKDAFGVLVALQNSGLGNANSVAEFLMNFHFDTLRARHELGNDDRRTPLVGDYQNRPKGC